MPMSKWQSKVRLTTDLEAVEQPATEEPSNDRPFVIIVLGDFLGTADGVPRGHMGPLQLCWEACWDTRKRAYLLSFLSAP